LRRAVRSGCRPSARGIFLERLLGDFFASLLVATGFFGIVRSALIDLRSRRHSPSPALAARIRRARVHSTSSRKRAYRVKDSVRTRSATTTIARTMNRRKSKHAKARFDRNAHALIAAFECARERRR